MSISINEPTIVSDNAHIGDGTRIWQFCNIMADVEIGHDCNIGQGVFIESGVRIGNHVKIKNNISLYKGVNCEDNVFLGPNCVFTNVINPRAHIEKKDEIRNTPICEGATIGANSTIICGHRIGRYAMVGAGAVVTKDVDDYELVVGNPAQKIGYVCECGERLSCMTPDRELELSEYRCSKCGSIYSENNGKLIKD